MPTPDSDLQAILAKRHHNGGDFWASPDGRIYVGNPFSTIGALLMLHELGVGAEHEAVVGGLELILGASREDGRIRLGPKTPMYPCYTAEAARVLCRFGRQGSREMECTVAYFLASAEEAGGWRCSFSRFGRGPETLAANPGATLNVLDALRFYPELLDGNETVDRAVDFLLGHWQSRKPLGPCHWGIGTLFLQVEYPFLRYNLFHYAYVLSFFGRARGDERFLDAWGVLGSKLDSEGRLVVERPHRALKGLDFCAKGLPSSRATARLTEIRDRLESREL